MDRVQQRLLWALGASALLHVWLVHTAQQPGAPRVTAAGGAPITATLAAPPVDLAAPETAPRDAPPPERKLTDSAPSQRGAVAEAARVAVERRVEQPRVAAPSDGTAALTQLSDPTYYAARDLDVFPRAITVLDLGVHAGTAGKVRATLLIDESGTVNEVRAIDASAAEIESAARDLLLRARFTPARKEGRIVKAQVRVSLAYGAR